MYNLYTIKKNFSRLGLFYKVCKAKLFKASGKYFLTQDTYSDKKLP